MRPQAATLFAIVFVAGCRGVLGIDDLTLVDGGVGDAGPHDGAGDSATQSDTGPADTGGDAPPACGGTTNKGDCEMCCGRDNMNAFTAFQMHVDQSIPCACTACMPGSQCTSAHKICGGSTPIMMTMCLGCVINTAIDNTCPEIVSACQQDATCRPYLGCVAGCKGLP